jgi:hypothetical protein
MYYLCVFGRENKEHFASALLLLLLLLLLAMFGNLLVCTKDRNRQANAKKEKVCCVWWVGPHLLLCRLYYLLVSTFDKKLHFSTTPLHRGGGGTHTHTHEKWNDSFFFGLTPLPSLPTEEIRLLCVVLTNKKRGAMPLTLLRKKERRPTQPKNPKAKHITLSLPTTKNFTFFYLRQIQNVVTPPLFVTDWVPKRNFSLL